EINDSTLVSTILVSTLRNIVVILKRIIEVTLNQLLLGFKKRIKIKKKKEFMIEFLILLVYLTDTFHNKSLDSELGTHESIFYFFTLL
ncbi:hypothetical protein ACJX0J_037783, partial [Zea mays]